MKGGPVLTATEARWLALEGQGLDRPRPARPAAAAGLRRVFGRVGVIQLDAVNVVARTQFLVPFSRLGPYDRAAYMAMSGPGGELVEGWAHMASLTPAATYPLLRPRMRSFAEGTSAWHRNRAAWARTEARYIAAVLDEVKRRGPLTASMLSDPRPRQGEWWGRRSIGRVALEWLFALGELAAWRNEAFERVYDLPERVLPPELLAAPAPSPDEAEQALLLAAAASLGVATVADLADYYRMPVARAKAAVADLVADGRLVPVTVEGWDKVAFCLPGAHPRPPTRATGTLLSPFDSLIWNRDRTLRLFGFDYRIEIYVPEDKRRFGYFVMPLLVGDQLVGRFDLKADRKEELLRVRGSYREPGVTATSVAEAAALELDALRSWLGLAGLNVARRGNLATSLAAAAKALSA